LRKRVKSPRHGFIRGHALTLDAKNQIIAKPFGPLSEITILNLLPFFSAFTSTLSLALFKESFIKYKEGNDIIILLLCGGDKNRQSSDIVAAKYLARVYRTKEGLIHE
jgi:hypothetical protein